MNYDPFDNVWRAKTFGHPNEGSTCLSRPACALGLDRSRSRRTYRTYPGPAELRMRGGKVSGIATGIANQTRPRAGAAERRTEGTCDIHGALTQPETVGCSGMDGSDGSQRGEEGAMWVRFARRR